MSTVLDAFVTTVLKGVQNPVLRFLENGLEPQRQNASVRLCNPPRIACNPRVKGKY
jgi:hypothetical protein